ncbi:hypothetical protein VP01_720g1 [Puccinia sorghi]|uniref:Uncharacterized protein n=1 Tax=Puccinia sorghi TaxID=27349 RepID=A0A0L6UD56_9BASI|nr:hypothetical protein VP01_720g1 [Puccinia sorghi]
MMMIERMYSGNGMQVMPMNLLYMRGDRLAGMIVGDGQEGGETSEGRVVEDMWEVGRFVVHWACGFPADRPASQTFIFSPLPNSSNLSFFFPHPKPTPFLRWLHAPFHLLLSSPTPFLIPLLSSLVLSSLPDFFLLCLALNLSFVSCFFLALLHHSSLRSSFSSSSSSSSLDRCVCVCSFVSSVVWVYTSFKYVSLADRIMLLHRHTLAVISLGDWLAGGRYQEYPVGSAVRLDTESHSLSSRTFSSSCNTGMCDGTLLCTSHSLPSAGCSSQHPRENLNGCTNSCIVFSPLPVWFRHTTHVRAYKRRLCPAAENWARQHSLMLPLFASYPVVVRSLLSSQSLPSPSPPPPSNSLSHPPSYLPNLLLFFFLICISCFSLFFFFLVLSIDFFFLYICVIKIGDLSCTPKQVPDLNRANLLQICPLRRQKKRESLEKRKSEAIMQKKMNQLTHKPHKFSPIIHQIKLMKDPDVLVNKVTKIMRLGKFQL